MTLFVHYLTIATLAWVADVVDKAQNFRLDVSLWRELADDNKHFAIVCI